MIDEREIWACALQIIRVHGESAWFHATRRVDALSEDGDAEGACVWARILACIISFEGPGEARLQ